LNHEEHEEHEGAQQDKPAGAVTRRVREIPARLTFKCLSLFVFFFVDFVCFVVTKRLAGHVSAVQDGYPGSTGIFWQLRNTRNTRKGAALRPVPAFSRLLRVS
jgi:hypothetical protein